MTFLLVCSILFVANISLMKTHVGYALCTSAGWNNWTISINDFYNLQSLQADKEFIFGIEGYCKPKKGEQDRSSFFTSYFQVFTLTLYSTLLCTEYSSSTVLGIRDILVWIRVPKEHVPCPYLWLINSISWYCDSGFPLPSLLLFLLSVEQVLYM